MASNTGYQYLDRLGIKVRESCSGGVSYVRNDEVNAAIEKNGLSMEDFSDLFGIQTCPLIDDGETPFAALYPWDVDAVLARMISGALIGSQKHWD